PQTFGHRAHDEEVETLQAPEDVSSKSRKQDVLFEVVFPNLTLERLAQLAFAKNHEADVRHLLYHQSCGFDDVPLSLAGNERGQIAHPRRVARELEFLMHVNRNGGQHMLEIDALMDRDDAVWVDAVRQQNPMDRI